MNVELSHSMILQIETSLASSRMRNTDARQHWTEILREFRHAVNLAEQQENMVRFQEAYLDVEFVPVKDKIQVRKKKYPVRRIRT